MTWITDEKGNRASIEHWGSEERARASLTSLVNCYNCSDCYDCYECSRCSGCSECSRCSDCSRCYECYDCSGERNKNEEPMAIPVIPKIHRQILEQVSVPGSLEMADWHSCATTHCRSGWVITLAGEDGRALEKRYGTLLAAMMIYDASDPSYKINPCRFFDSNEKAMADMEAMATKE